MMRRWTVGLSSGVMMLALAGAWAADTSVDVAVQADQTRIGMGRSVTVTARATKNAQPVAGALLLPLVNGKRWGAHDYSDAQGRATFNIPLPTPGSDRIEVAGFAPQLPATERWIWSQQLADHQDIYAQTTFTMTTTPLSGKLYMAVDDSSIVYVNGVQVGTPGGWGNVQPIDVVAKLKTGVNVLSIKGTNGTGPAGLLVRLEAGTLGGKQAITSGADWQIFASAPVGWPGAVASGGAAPQVLGPPDVSPWGAGLGGWPGVIDQSILYNGATPAAGTKLSNAVTVQVDSRTLQTPLKDPNHQIGAQWEPWFVYPGSWSTAYVVPLMGFYNSGDPTVFRQHMIWMIESGVDILFADWTNHLWGQTTWDYNALPDGSRKIIEATTSEMDVLAQMRDEGLPVPKMVLLTGINNGVFTTPEALNGELGWVYQNYVQNAKYHDLFVNYLGKPLIVVFNGAGPDWLQGQAAIDGSHFTIRYMSAQHDGNHMNDLGYWTWMDGALRQPWTTYNGQVESLTASVAFFSGGGWLAPTAYGRRGGWTYLESFRTALEHPARFLELHQFNEFAGQAEGQGYGDNHDVYVDSYNVEFSDDFEPISLTTPAYRGQGGYGFFHLNLTRALVDLYRQGANPQSTVVAVSNPLMRQVVTGNQLTVTWTALGKTATGYTLTINGTTVASNVQGTNATVDLGRFGDGPLRLRLTAEGTQSRYLLSYTSDSLPLVQPVPAYVEVDFYHNKVLPWTAAEHWATLE